MADAAVSTHALPRRGISSGVAAAERLGTGTPTQDRQDMEMSGSRSTGYAIVPDAQSGARFGALVEGGPVVLHADEGFDSRTLPG